MDIKLIVEIVDGIVVWVKKMDWNIWEDNMLPYFPYGKEGQSFGNPYANALRARDHRRSRGRTAEVLLIDDTDIKKYLLKRYLGAAEGFVNDDESEDERLHRVNMSLVPTSFYPKNNIVTLEGCDVDFS